MIEFETYEGVEVVLFLDAPVIRGSCSPGVLVGLLLFYLSYGKGLVLLAGIGQRTPEAVVIAECEGEVAFGAESKTVDGLVFESGLVGDGVSVFLSYVGLDVVDRVGVLEQGFLVGVGCAGSPEDVTEFADTVGGTRR